MDLDILQHYVTGIDKLDEQHRELCVLVNTILANIDNKELCIKLLIEYTEASHKHFDEEEEYMHDIGYPYIASHQVDHARLVAKIKACVYDLEFRNIGRLERYLINKLGRDLLTHVDVYDIQLGVYARRKKEG